MVCMVIDNVVDGRFGMIVLKLDWLWKLQNDLDFYITVFKSILTQELMS